MDGHYLKGYGDRSENAHLHLIPGVDGEAKEYLEGHPETNQHLDRVKALIEGFESPWGLELLATIHWLAWQENPAVKQDPEEAIRAVAEWSERKRAYFRPEHVRIAWQRLREQGWFPGDLETPVDSNPSRPSINSSTR